MHEFDLPAEFGLWLALAFVAFCATASVVLFISMRRAVLNADADSSPAQKVGEGEAGASPKSSGGVSE